MKTIALIDSGAWSAGKASEPRVYQPLRELIATERIKMTSMSYIESPKRPLPKALLEHNGAETMQKQVDQDRRWVEQERVKFTAARFQTGIKDIKDIKDIKTIDADVVFISGRSDENRTALITSLLDETQAEFIVISPPYFSNEEEIRKIREINRADERVVPYLPYRFAQGVQDTKNFLIRDGLSIVGAQLRVISAPFPPEAFVAEFCMPSLDVLTEFAGPLSPHTLNVSYTAPEALPILSATALHENGVSSSILISAAGGSFQSMDHVNLVLLSSSQAYFELNVALTLCTYRSAAHNQVSRQFSHDIVGSQINGSRPLLNQIFGLSQSNPSSIQLPRLSNFLSTQVLIDKLVAAVLQEKTQ